MQKIVVLALLCAILGAVFAAQESDMTVEVVPAAAAEEADEVNAVFDVETESELTEEEVEAEEKLALLEESETDTEDAELPSALPEDMDAANLADLEIGEDDEGEEMPEEISEADVLREERLALLEETADVSDEYASVTAAAPAQKEADETILGGKLPSEVMPMATVFMQADAVMQNKLAADARTCYAVGDPHFTSFDGLAFSFQGIGQFDISKSNRLDVQARNFVCGASAYYGTVGCFNTAAVRYTDPGTRTSDTIEIFFQPPTSWVKVNNVLLNDENARLKTGVEVYKYVDSGNPMVAVRTPEGAGATFGPYAVYVHERAGTPTWGLCGNNNGNPADDMTWYDHSKTITCTDMDCIDNDPKKPMHAWGLSYMITAGHNIPNIFYDTVAGVDHPNDKDVGEPQFKDPAFKAKAMDFCKSHAQTYKWYFDCMFDSAAMGSLQLARTDTAAETADADLKANTARYKPERTELIKTLNKMELDLGIERDSLEEADKNQLAELATKTQKAKDTTVDRAALCDKPVVSADIAVRNAEREYERLNGEHAAAASAYARDSGPWFKTIECDKSQRDLLNQMEDKLSTLVNVKDVEELDVDQKALAAEPKLKESFSELIQRAHAGNTDAVKGMLDDLLKKVNDELTLTTGMETKAKKRVADLAQAKQIAHATLRSALDKQAAAHKACHAAQVREAVAGAAFRAITKQQKIDSKAHKERYVEIGNEIDMGRNLNDKIMEWGKATSSVGLKKCVTDLEESVESVHMAQQDKMWLDLANAIKTRGA